MNNRLLQAIIGFWRDCIKSESALEQSFVVHRSAFALNKRTRAVLFDEPSDPFIFSENIEGYNLSTGRAYELATQAQLSEHELYFGFPMLMFFDRATQQNRIAPLLVMRLEVTVDGTTLNLKRAESAPTLGSSAFQRLGLQQEEIVALNSEVSEVFEKNRAGKLDTILYLLRKETTLTFVEGIDPSNLSKTNAIQPYTGTVVYNKAVLFASEASAFNFHVLNDLEKLIKKTDIDETALGYLIESQVPNKDREVASLCLPFSFDEYQLKAIRHILSHTHTVVTGPPGTGKSQFIANLIVNLFLQKKKVLFVSHTSEAVRVVNERVNQEFANLMMQTGKKAIRQDLGQQLKEMVGQYNTEKSPVAGTVPEYKDIEKSWHEIERLVKHVQLRNRLHGNIERLVSKEGPHGQTTLFKRVHRYISTLQLYWLTNRLRMHGDSGLALATIKARKSAHVALSRAYMKAHYLQLIFESDLYGELHAYIDAIQNKKVTGAQANERSDKYIRAALKTISIWSCTLKSLAASFPLHANLFDYVIFDEASQIDLPSAAPALYRAKRLVVVGDQNQLNHIAKINPQLEDDLARTYDLVDQSYYPALISYSEASLFNSAKKALKEPEQELRNHYRSHASIANLFSTIFYGGTLTIHEPDITLPDGMSPGVHWLDVKGTAHRHKAGSRYNSQEVAYIIKLLERLLPLTRAHQLTIGITTPYAKQREIIFEEVTKRFTLDELAQVKILTVHQFQGSEVDILIFSTVLAQNGDGNSDTWYVRNEQILNVAISRAKQLLLIVGDITFATKSESKLQDIARYCQLLAETPVAPSYVRPMNNFEKRLFDLLKITIPDTHQIEPQYVIGGRFTIDFAILSEKTKLAIELDGKQHEIIGGLPVFEDSKRDSYLQTNGWNVIRITVYDLVRNPEAVAKRIVSSIKSES